MLADVNMELMTSLAVGLRPHFGEVVKNPSKDAARLQYLCEAANAAAKEVDNVYYQLKNFALLCLAYHHPYTTRYRVSLGMTEIVCRTEEYG